MVLHCFNCNINPFKCKWNPSGWKVQNSVETNIRIYSNIRIFSSEYWYSYSIRGHFQNPNIIRIFEYFGLNIQKLFDGKILEFLRNKGKIWTIFCKQGVDLQFLLMGVNIWKILSDYKSVFGVFKNFGFRNLFIFLQNYSNIFKYSNIFRYSNNIRIFSWWANNIQYSIRSIFIRRIIFDIRFTMAGFARFGTKG